MATEYRIARTLDDLSHLRDEWTGLLTRAGIATPFLTWEWMAGWWQIYCAEDRERRLAVVTARREGVLVGLLPGYIHAPSFGLSTFAFLGTEYESTDYLQTIAASEELADLTQGLLDTLLREEPALDVLHLTNVLSPDPMLAALETFAGRTGASYTTEPFRVCPFIATGGTWDAFVESLSAKMRKNVRRYTRQIFEAGAEFDWVTDRSEIRRAVGELFTLHARRFETKDADTGFRADIREPFHGHVSELFFDRDMLRLFRLRAKGQTIAALYCFESGNGLFFFQAGIDPEWEKLSVGTVLIGLAIKYTFDKQLALFDFMRGEEAYKFRWTSTTRPIVAARLGVSTKGRAGLALRRQGLKAKAIVKKVIYARRQAAEPVSAS